MDRIEMILFTDEGRVGAEAASLWEVDPADIIAIEPGPDNSSLIYLDDRLSHIDAEDSVIGPVDGLPAQHGARVMRKGGHTLITLNSANPAAVAHEDPVLLVVPEKAGPALRDEEAGISYVCCGRRRFATAAKPKDIMRLILNQRQLNANKAQAMKASAPKPATPKPF